MSQTAYGGPGPYGEPPSDPHGGYQRPPGANGLATAGIVLGRVGIGVIGLLVFFGLLAGLSGM